MELGHRLLVGISQVVGRNRFLIREVEGPHHWRVALFSVLYSLSHLGIRLGNSLRSWLHSIRDEFRTATAQSLKRLLTESAA